ncbi:AAC(3) family N-acetyltransferase [Pseudoflavitalea sp. G-6-1-2]|uniref:AAC(3) family N-acetyltransferase n=1 Tax=Pseudoflavitalea sp. G-6-1-2 TaxID=2728841 RepID=UPI00146F2DB8|nr:AAC(3) family N-acetyltransferase [Pseudoflavitalea sp. G-6-1-2]NML21524.1 AAC(3) family N-acetyltransferase [Pseudoflavitalea sp. G-6-1-2]
MRSFQTIVDGGPEMIMHAFLQTGCTILVPTFTYQFEAKPIPPYMPERNGAGDYRYFLSKKYDEPNSLFSTDGKEISVEEMGVFAKCVLDSNASLRGNHPLNSFTAVGPDAKRLTERQSPMDVYAPFRQLIEDNGRILLMGTGLDSATIIHYAEQLAGRQLFIRWAYDNNKQVMPVQTGGCSDGFNNIEKILQPIETKTIVGGSIWRSYDAGEMVKLCVKEIIRHPQITHCDNPDCERCNDAIAGGPIIDFE